MFIVIYRAKGRLNCETQYFGPWADYMDAEDFLCTLPVARDCDCKFIQEIDMMVGNAIEPLEEDKA